MILGIDASNIKHGGGITHLAELLEHANPSNYGFKKVIVYGGNNLNALPNKIWLQKKQYNLLNRGFLKASYWKVFVFTKEILKDKINILFCPGGTYLGSFKPFVAMCQNMLIFEKTEWQRFPTSFPMLRYIILNFVQTKTFKNANGVIFISEYAQDYVGKKIQIESKKMIYHGVSLKFYFPQKDQLASTAYSFQKPYKILYVSIINFYKHQWNVINAVKNLRNKGFPIELHLIGGNYPKALKKMNQEIALIENNDYIFFHGEIPYNQIQVYYQKADAFLFASTCENMPNILLEAMASNLPIISSNFGPMPEILKNLAYYIDPTSISSIEEGIKNNINNPKKRDENLKNYNIELNKYSWEKIADKTFSYLQMILNKNNNGNRD